MEGFYCTSCKVMVMDKLNAGERLGAELLKHKFMTLNMTETNTQQNESKQYLVTVLIQGAWHSGDPTNKDRIDRRYQWESRGKVCLGVTF